MKINDILSSQVGKNLLDKGELPAFVVKLDQETLLDLAALLVIVVFIAMLLAKTLFK